MNKSNGITYFCSKENKINEFERVYLKRDQKEFLKV